MAPTAHGIAKINHLNRQGTDHFLKLMRKHRRDLAGLPFIMGDACRMNKEQSRQFVNEVALVRNSKDRLEGLDAKKEPTLQPVRIAALMQMLAIEPAETRGKLARYLAGVNSGEATRALARLAIFSFEEEVRRAALVGLKNRGGDVPSDLLLGGMRYPWPAIARFAADAIVKLLVECRRSSR